MGNSFYGVWHSPCHRHRKQIYIINKIKYHLFILKIFSLFYNCDYNKKFAFVNPENHTTPKIEPQKTQEKKDTEITEKKQTHREHNAVKPLTHNMNHKARKGHKATPHPIIFVYFVITSSASCQTRACPME
jgi:hypothetical protein